MEDKNEPEVVTATFTCKQCPGCGDPYYIDGCPDCGYGIDGHYPREVLQ